MSRPDRRLVTFATLVGSLILAVTSVGAVAAAEPPGLRARDARPAWDTPTEAATDRYIIEFAAGTNRAARQQVARAEGLTIVRPIRGSSTPLYVATGTNLNLARIRGQSDVVSVTRSLKSERLVEPTDPGWTLGYMWGLHNTGQTIWDRTGVSNVDIDAQAAWARTTGSSDVVVAVIDDGVDFSHPDLAARAWTNPGEILNGIDDDGNGYIDDINGWDFCHDDNSVHDFDDDYHGTHVAGTIAASLDGQGIVGVAPTVKIMALKFLGDDPECGYDDQAIAAINYAKSFGVRISNNSWGRRGGTTFQNAPLYNAIRDSGMLFVAAAGNDGINNDTNSAPAYPASFDLANILSVGAVNNRGRLPGFSNYGKTSVDLFAPGVDIVSALPADSEYPVGWGWLSGTSMAAPHVTGIAALVGSVQPSLLSSSGIAIMKSRIMSSGKKLADVSGKSVTDAIPSAPRAIDFVAPTAHPPASHAFVNKSRLTKTVKVRVGWPAATDDLSGVASYAVHNSVNGGTWTKITGSTTARTLDRSLSIGSKYRYRVRATDRAANTSAWRDGPQIVPRRYQENHKKITFSNGWKRVAVTGASGGRTRYATRAGAWAKYTFTGRALAVVAPKSSGRGSVKVYIDGVHVKTVSTQRAKTQSKVLVYTKAWAQPGTHTVKLVVVGTKGHPRFDLDALLVLK